MISNQQVLKVRLEKLNKTLVSVFCLLCAERLFGIYKVFANKFSFSHLAYLEIIEKAYELIFKPDEKQLRALRDKLEKFIPDSEEYPDVVANQAQCSGLCLMYALDYLESGDVSIAWASFEKIEEVIDLYAYMRGGDFGLFEKEVDYQIETITFLEKHNLEEVLKEYRKRNTKSLIPIVMDLNPMDIIGLWSFSAFTPCGDPVNQSILVEDYAYLNYDHSTNKKRNNSVAYFIGELFSSTILDGHRIPLGEDIQIEFTLYPAHVGEPAKIFAFIEHRLNGVIRGYNICFNQQLLDGTEEQLVQIYLPTKLTLYLSYKQLSILGEFWVYVGYCMSQGSVVSNGLTPLKFEMSRTIMSHPQQMSLF
jgi:hypothetical protein